MKSSYIKNHIEQLSNRVWLLLHFTFAFCLFTTLPGCEQTFQPIKDNSRAPFSMFGYLDVSADTQWVRVTPVRGQIDISTEVPEMTVNVTDLETGNSAAFNDSLFLSPDGRHILNAWNTTDILKPEQTVRFKAERPDGASSQVNISFPPDFPTPRMEIYEVSDLVLVYIEGVERLVEVQVRALAHVISPSAGWDFIDVFKRPIRRITKTGAGTYRVLMTPGSKYVLNVPEPPADDLEVEFLDHQIFVASGGPEWREDLGDLRDIEYSLPEEISNVEDGTGYMFGIVSKSIPFESCYDEQGEFIACPEEAPLHRAGNKRLQ
ncbi:MAG: hypothetical protein RI575_04615 [Balneolaceae bacterium]|nr:hypothetical protein [Balneolaceae bacterium]MDR9407462.1 hypothetical protein [Balneolaceae bacterium]